MLGGGVIVQRLKLTGEALYAGQISKSPVKPTLQGASPGDLSFVLPFRFLQDVQEMLLAVDNYSD